MQATHGLWQGDHDALIITEMWVTGCGVAAGVGVFLDAELVC